MAKDICTVNYRKGNICSQYRILFYPHTIQLGTVCEERCVFLVHCVPEVVSVQLISFFHLDQAIDSDFQLSSPLLFSSTFSQEEDCIRLCMVFIRYTYSPLRSILNFSGRHANTAAISITSRFCTSGLYL